MSGTIFISGLSYTQIVLHLVPHLVPHLTPHLTPHRFQQLVSRSMRQFGVHVTKHPGFRYSNPYSPNLHGLGVSLIYANGNAVYDLFVFKPRITVGNAQRRLR